MKPVVIVILVLMSCMLASMIVGARGTTFEHVDAALSTTGRALADTLRTSTGTAQSIEGELESPQRLSQALQEFNRTTDHLERLCRELDTETSAYETARRDKLTSLDHELQAINDPRTRHRLERVRDRIKKQSAARLLASRAAIAKLRGVLQHGNDLQHAARCVQLVRELAVHGDDLQDQVRFTRLHAAAYTRLTKGFLAALSSTPTRVDAKDAGRPTV